MSAARSAVVCSSASIGTTLLTTPYAAIRPAGIGRAVNSISLTKCRSATLSRFNVPDRLYGTPRRAGVIAKVASDEATIRSQDRTTSQAPPHTDPPTMAITGVGCASTWRMIRRRGSLYVSGSRPLRGSSWTSWPAEKMWASGAARRTTTRMSGGCRGASAAATLPSSEALRALTGGLANVIQATESRISTWTLAGIGCSSPARRGGVGGGRPPSLTGAASNAPEPIRVLRRDRDPDFGSRAACHERDGRT